MSEKYEKGEPISGKHQLSKEEMDKLNGYLQYLGENVKLQITMSFLSLYFIGSKYYVDTYQTRLFDLNYANCFVVLCGDCGGIYCGSGGWSAGFHPDGSHPGNTHLLPTHSNGSLPR